MSVDAESTMAAARAMIALLCAFALIAPALGAVDVDEITSLPVRK